MIPKWVENWIEKIDDPIIDITCVTVDIGDMVAEDVRATQNIDVANIDCAGEYDG